MEYKGFDICEYQGRVDWPTVKAAGYDFGIFRISKRNKTIDPQFENNYNGARSVGMKVGVYIYSYALSENDAMEEANRVCDIMAGRPLDMPVWLDLEWENQAALGADKITAIANKFIETIRFRSAYNVGIYTNQHWHDNLIKWNKLPAVDWWAARVPKNDNGTTRLTPKGSYTVHQYSWKGVVPGIPAKEIDMDVCVKEYWNDEKGPHWIHTEDGSWYYRIAPGVNAHGFMTINHHRYYFDKNGKMQTGWFQVDNAWYYAQPSGGLEGAIYRTDEIGRQAIWYLD